MDSLVEHDGHHALVTGGGGNIGAGIARRLAAGGARVAVHYNLSAAGADDCVDEIARQGGEARAVQADLVDEAAVDALFADLAATGGVPDIVVNNAGIYPVAGLNDMSLAEFDATMTANLTSAFLVSRQAARHWIDSGVTGAIIDIASTEATDPNPGHAHYTASKGGLLAFTRASALEFGGYGIRVNAVSPGLIYRDGIEDAWPDGVARWRSRAPLGTLGTVDDVAVAVAFLASDAARWISGVNLPVDGGMSVQSRW